MTADATAALDTSLNSGLGEIRRTDELGDTSCLNTVRTVDMGLDEVGAIGHFLGTDVTLGIGDTSTTFASDTKEFVFTKLTLVGAQTITSELFTGHIDVVNSSKENKKQAHYFILIGAQMDSHCPRAWEK